jgi:hypothetical protein
MSDLPPLLEYAEAARNRAMRQVEQNNGEWFSIALLQIEQLGKRECQPEMTGEDIRHTVEPAIGKPTHPNAWGAVIATAVRRKLIFDTGRVGRMTSITSHARKTTIYAFHPQNPA